MNLFFGRMRQGVFVLPALLCAGSVNAAFIVVSLDFGFQMPGTVLEINLNPTKPEPGQAFTVEVSGIANKVCPPVFDDEYETGIVRGEIWVGASEGSCDLQDLPLTFSEEFPISAEAWDELSVTDDQVVQFTVVGEPFEIGGGIPVLRNKSSVWVRSFDLQRGLHDIPSNLGSGYWVREDLPNEGLLIQQEGDTIVLYLLSYGPELTSQNNYAPTWVYSNATFEGDSTNGVAISIAKSNPEEAEVVFESVLSASILVDDVNHIRAIFDAGPTSLVSDLEYSPYRRFQFNRTKMDRPAVIPDFSGVWTVYRFDGDTQLDSYDVELKNGAFLDTDRWQFMSEDERFRLICKVNNLGDGRCTLEDSDSSETLVFQMADFNGNVASGEFADGADDAVFLRSGFQLP